jgi:hypothetical protein
VFPLVWAGLTHNWDALGFSRRNLGSPEKRGPGMAFCPRSGTLVLLIVA